jgi:hypothetical protein
MSNTNPNLKRIVLPVGWNALINAEKKTALVIGEYKYVSEANTVLTLVTKPTEAELLAAIPAGYTPVYPSKPVAPVAPKA